MTKAEERIRKGLLDLYKKLAKHTREDCRLSKPPCNYYCCESRWCETAIHYAKVRWGVEIRRTKHPRFLLLGPKGCTAAPHLRPICTLHICWIGTYQNGDKGKKWAKTYFKIRDNINTEEFRLDKILKAAKHGKGQCTPGAPPPTRQGCGRQATEPRSESDSSSRYLPEFPSST